MRRFRAEFKKRVALEALRGDSTVHARAAKHEVQPKPSELVEEAGGGRAGEVFSTERKSGSGQTLAELTPKATRKN